MVIEVFLKRKWRVSSQVNSENNRKKIEQGARTRLLDAGVKLFSEKGYANTSVREIVELAGVSKPILYYYFKSKEGIFRSILDYALRQQEHVLEEALKKPGSVLDRLIYLYRIMYRALMEDRNLFKFIHNLIFGPHQGAGLEGIEQYHRRIVDAIKTIYIDGLAKGEVKKASPDEVAFLVLGVLDFCIHLDYVHPELLDQKRPERLLRLAFFGLNGIHHPHLEEV
jgi:TetR/AcrR family transcriptional regulator